MIRSVIIDDDLHSRNMVSNIINEYCDNIDIVGQGHNVESGVKIIDIKKPDLIFLDIQMPDGDGFDLLSRISHKQFKVIFITGFDQYAIKAIRLSALDYILKPVQPDLLIKAVQKMNQDDSKDNSEQGLINTFIKNQDELHTISLPTQEGYRFIKLDDIVRCEADSNYTNFHSSSGEKIMVTNTLKEYESLLSSLNFCRIHQSHLINMKYIDRYLKGEGGTLIMKDGTSIEVSRRKKEHFLNKVKNSRIK